MATTQNTPHLKDELKRSKATLQMLRDEIRVRLHLARMDVKDEFHKLDPQADALANEITRAGENVTESTRKALDEIVKRLQKLRASIS